MAKTKPIPHRTLDIYNAQLWLCRNLKEWNRLRKTLGDLPGEPVGLGQTNYVTKDETDEYGCVIYIDPTKLLTQPNLVDTTAHEAAHAARFILNHIGETERTHECEAYLSGWIAGWIWENLTTAGKPRTRG